MLFSLKNGEILMISSYSNLSATTYTPNKQEFNTPDKTSKREIQHNQLSGIYALADRFNVKSISESEIGLMSKELYNLGEISQLQETILSFKPNAKNLDEKSFVTKADSSNKYNLLDEYSARVKLNESFSKEKNIVNNSKILESLIKLDSIKSGPVNIVV